MAPQNIRQDRILDEAFATSGDMRQVIDLVGLSAVGAHRYTNVATRAELRSD